MSLVDEMRGLALRGEGVLGCSWCAESDGAGGEGRLRTGASWWMAVGLVEGEAGAGRTRGYLAVAVRVERE